MSEKELSIYFKSDKKDWITNGENGQEWNKDEVAEFWRKIRKEKVAKDNFNFTGYCFPLFETTYLSDTDKILSKDCNFWMKGEERSFDKNVLFDNCTFMSKAIFGSVVFKKEASFSYTQFTSAYFGYSIFSKKLRLSYSNFTDRAIFHGIICKEDVLISECIFNEEAQFYDSKIQGLITTCSFKKEVSFVRSNFKHVLLTNCQFQDDVFFDGVNFKGRTYFEHIGFYRKASFRGIILTESVYFSISSGKILIENINPDWHFLVKYIIHELDKVGQFSDEKIKECICLFQSSEDHVSNIHPKLEIKTEEIEELTNSIKSQKNDLLKKDMIYDFSYVNFSSKNVFRNLDLTICLFNDSDLSDIIFRECKWNASKRLILYKEKDHSYESQETLYRQLKTNFDKVKAWELSGKAYRSEMLMRRKSLFKLAFNKYFFFAPFRASFWEWLVYLIYGRTSGFTQSFLTPLGLFFLSAFILFPAYYYFEESCYCINYEGLCRAYQLSVEASFPFFKSTITYENWIVKYSETMLNGTLLTFFILSLRKRFKQ